MKTNNSWYPFYPKQHTLSSKMQILIYICICIQICIQTYVTLLHIWITVHTHERCWESQKHCDSARIHTLAKKKHTQRSQFHTTVVVEPKASDNNNHNSIHIQQREATSAKQAIMSHMLIFALLFGATTAWQEQCCSNKATT